MTGPTRKIPTKTTRTATKRTVPAKTTTPKKNVVKKDKPDTSNETKEGNTPKTTVTGGWKGRAKKSKEIIQPRVLRPKSETWGKKVAEEKTDEKKTRGFIMFIYAMAKVGKTKLGHTSADFEGYEGKKYIVPRGYPEYVLDTEISSEMEAILKFRQQYDEGKIIIEDCYIESEITKEVDAIASMEKIEEWAYALMEDVDGGTLVIDSFSDYCEYTYIKLVDKVLGIGFTEDGKEKKAVMPLKYKWRNKKVVSFLRNMRKLADKGMNVILLAQAKDEYAKGGDGAMDAYKTGKIVADALGKTTFWVDIIGVMDKEEDEDGFIDRRLYITDSRFEKQGQKKEEYVLKNDEISVSNVIGLFEDLL